MTVPRGRVLDAVRIGLLVLILLGVGIALWRNWSAVSTELGRMSGGALLAAFVLTTAAPLHQPAAGAPPAPRPAVLAAGTSRYCRPSVSYITGDPAKLPPKRDDHNCLPLSLSHARI